MNSLRAFAPYWQSIQRALFPHLERVLGPLTEKQQQLVQTLEVIRIEQMIPPRFPLPGRPPKDRAAMARAFVAKAVYRLHRQTLLADGVDGESPGGPAQAGRGGAVRTGRSDHRLRATPGERGRAGSAIDGHRIRTPPRALGALGQRGASIDLRFLAAASVGSAGIRQRDAAAQRHEAAPAKAGGQGGSTGLHLHRARGARSATACRDQATLKGPGERYAGTPAVSLEVARVAVEHQHGAPRVAFAPNATSVFGIVWVDESAGWPG